LEEEAIRLWIYPWSSFYSDHSVAEPQPKPFTAEGAEKTKDWVVYCSEFAQEKKIPGNSSAEVRKGRRENQKLGSENDAYMMHR
jgi:hypothetical protein